MVCDNGSPLPLLPPDAVPDLRCRFAASMAARPTSLPLPAVRPSSAVAVPSPPAAARGRLRPPRRRDGRGDFDRGRGAASTGSNTAAGMTPGARTGITSDSGLIWAGNCTGGVRRGGVCANENEGACTYFEQRATGRSWLCDELPGLHAVFVRVNLPPETRDLSSADLELLWFPRYVFNHSRPWNSWGAGVAPGVSRFGTSHRLLATSCRGRLRSWLALVACCATRRRGLCARLLPPSTLAPPILDCLRLNGQW